MYRDVALKITFIYKDEVEAIDLFHADGVAVRSDECLHHFVLFTVYRASNREDEIEEFAK
ncbi:MULTISPECIES: hypothetical protein [Paenibacillus]|uniref:Uncharacterized protein n=1 Tax=Paenibacillus cucumis (ex Kampfer et al. 2016) TaxID=1776858 RepID=A0ABS7KFF6_9BACL|nr:hypothetical protein [Paenibacillus cucumis (ex Kampfer et al. 2016)]MBY0202862.1 hypothetical protein [Paenibacillus cucumis (ex Kampfer et al. 2016)]MDP9700744.1 hypothetical protein [Paenibacillus intestini]